MRQGEPAQGGGGDRGRAHAQGGRAPLPAEARREPDRGRSASTRRRRRSAQALEKKPDLATARFNLGLVYEEQGQADEAIAAYEAELAQNAKAYRAAFNLAKLLQKAGRDRRGRARGSARRWSCSPTSGPASSTWPRRFSTRATWRARSSGRARASSRSPTPRIAPLGHFVLADVYNRQGRDGRRGARGGRAHAACRRARPRDGGSA